MILDVISNSKTYFTLGEKFQKAFEFIEQNRNANIEIGKYDICESVFAKVQAYDSKEDAAFEGHRKYIDIQYVLSGEEIMQYAEKGSCKTNTPYNDEKDVEFFDAEGDIETFIVKKDGFTVFFPNDIHKPGLKIDESIPVKKILIKIAAE